MTAMALIVLLGGLNLLQQQQYRDDEARANESRELVLEKLDSNQQSVLCYTQTQSQWDLAVTDLLVANVNPDDIDTTNALARLEGLRERLSQVRDLCFVESSSGP